MFCEGQIIGVKNQLGVNCSLVFEINTALVVGNREESDIDIFKIVRSGFAAQSDV